VKSLLEKLKQTAMDKDMGNCLKALMPQTWKHQNGLKEMNICNQVGCKRGNILILDMAFACLPSVLDYE